MNRRGFLQTLGVTLSAIIVNIVPTHRPHVLLVTNNPLHAAWVKSGSAYATVSDAMRAAHAGDTVLVNPGVYGEDVIVKGGVTLDGFKDYTSFRNIVAGGTLNLV